MTTTNDGSTEATTYEYTWEAKDIFTVTQNVLWEIHNERIRIKIKKKLQ